MNRTDILHFKASDAERAVAEKLARIEQVKLSEALRMCLREAAIRRGIWPTREVKSIDEIQKVEG